jgi:hypothetical protein
MSDLKEFLKQHYHECSKFNRPNVLVEDLGLFFWNSQGKWFVKNELIPNLPPEIDLYTYLVRRANECISDDTKVVLNYSFKAKGFLDSIVFLGEDKIKELIKKEGV